jgi:hypothetical protein
MGIAPRKDMREQFIVMNSAELPARCRLIGTVRLGSWIGRVTNNSIDG